MISKSGNNGGTYARSDIALEFASWLSPEFKLYVIQGTPIYNDALLSEDTTLYAKWKK